MDDLENFAIIMSISIHKVISILMPISISIPNNLNCHFLLFM